MVAGCAEEEAPSILELREGRGREEAVDIAVGHGGGYDGKP